MLEDKSYSLSDAEPSNVSQLTVDQFEQSQGHLSNRKAEKRQSSKKRQVSNINKQIVIFSEAQYNTEEQ